MLLLRLSPLIPYNALDYMSGVTSISTKDYSLALTGLLPGTIVFCYLGATASSLAEGRTSSEDGPIQTVAMVLGVIFALAAIVVASYYSRLELDKVSACLCVHLLVLRRTEANKSIYFYLSTIERF